MCECKGEKEKVTWQTSKLYPLVNQLKPINYEKLYLISS